MHPTAMKNARLFFETYAINPGVVVDIGAQDVNGSLKQVCPAFMSYIGVDCASAPGVDIVLEDPYQLPFQNDSVEIVVSSSCFEHSEMFWLLFLEIIRILKPDGLFYLNAPSSWPFHKSPQDCYRFFPDSGNALAKWGRRSGYNTIVLEHYTNFSDYVCVFLKDQGFVDRHPRRIIEGLKEFSCGGLYPDLETLFIADDSEQHKSYAPQLFQSRFDLLPAKNETVSTEPIPQEIPEHGWKIIEFVKPYTMTTAQRVANVINAVDYVVANRIDGAFVECGVWRGGCSMAAACALLLKESADRELFLYDTFEGMSPPSEHDIRIENGISASELLAVHEKGPENHIWAYAPIEDVKSNLDRTTYPKHKMHFTKGKVEDTIPAVLPGPIAILRLDTDWYESTLHELKHLYPLLVRGGVLILDDYGCWAGARKAVDEYFAGLRVKPELIQINDNCGSTAFYAILP